MTSNQIAVASQSLNSIRRVRPLRPAKAMLNSTGCVPGALHSNAVATLVVNSNADLRPLRPARKYLNSTMSLPGAPFQNGGNRR